jgi:hypothetical protein
MHIQTGLSAEIWTPCSRTQNGRHATATSYSAQVSEADTEQMTDVIALEELESLFLSDSAFSVRSW